MQMCIFSTAENVTKRMQEYLSAECRNQKRGNTTKSRPPEQIKRSVFIISCKNHFNLLTSQTTRLVAPVLGCIFFDIGSQHRFAIQAKVRIHLCDTHKAEKAAARTVFQADISAFTAFSPCNTKFNSRTSATRTIHIFTPESIVHLYYMTNSK